MFEQGRETTLAYLVQGPPRPSGCKNSPRGNGTTYPDMAWEPKQAFGAVASFYATH